MDAHGLALRNFVRTEADVFGGAGTASCWVVGCWAGPAGLHIGGHQLGTLSGQHPHQVTVPHGQRSHQRRAAKPALTQPSERPPDFAAVSQVLSCVMSSAATTLDCHVCHASFPAKMKNMPMPLELMLACREDMHSAHLDLVLTSYWSGWGQGVLVCSIGRCAGSQEGFSRRSVPCRGCQVQGRGSLEVSCAHVGTLVAQPLYLLCSQHSLSRSLMMLQLVIAHSDLIEIAPAERRLTPEFLQMEQYKHVTDLDLEEAVGMSIQQNRCRSLSNGKQP